MNAQSGNVLFYILIAVALLAALTFAVSQSGRGTSSNITEDRARLYASEILEFANTMSAAVSQLRLRGVENTELCFDHADWGVNDYDHAGCTDNVNRIFHIDGAGVAWQNAPSEAMDAGASPDNLWYIYGDNEVENVGSTCGAAACADLILVVDELSEIVCRQLNALLSVTDADTAPPTDTDIGETRYVGAFGYAETIGDEAGGVDLAGQTSGCFNNTTGSRYTFYKVLIAR